MTNSKERIITQALIEKLLGNVSFFHSVSEREQFIEKSLAEVIEEFSYDPRASNEAERLKNPRARKDFIRNFLSYDIVDSFVRDPDIEEVFINSLDPIYVHSSKSGMIETNLRFAGWLDLEMFIKKCLVFSGKNKLENISDLHLPDIKGRVNIVFSPYGYQITLVKLKQNPLSIIDLVELGTLTFKLAAQLWLYVEGLNIRPANILIAGGPGAGKTTLLNALFSFFSPKERLVLIEDTLELNIPFEENISRLECQKDLDLRSLVKNSLRMRPDRIIIGEVRGAEAHDLMTAMNVGKFCLGTLHAPTAREAVTRLENEPMNIPSELIPLMDVIVILKRKRIGKGEFRTICELVEISGLEKKKVLLSELWSYEDDKGQLVELSSSTVYRDRLASVLGIKGTAILKEIDKRAEILQTFQGKNIRSIKEISEFARLYTSDPNKFEAALQKR